MSINTSQFIPFKKLPEIQNHIKEKVITFVSNYSAYAQRCASLNGHNDMPLSFAPTMFFLSSLNNAIRDE